MLLSERDELQFVVCKNIEMEYMLKLSGIEDKADEAQCAALRWSKAQMMPLKSAMAAYKARFLRAWRQGIM